MLLGRLVVQDMSCTWPGRSHPSLPSVLSFIIRPSVAKGNRLSGIFRAIFLSMSLRSVPMVISITQEIHTLHLIIVHSNIMSQTTVTQSCAACKPRVITRQRSGCDQWKDTDIQFDSVSTPADFNVLLKSGIIEHKDNTLTHIKCGRGGDTFPYEEFQTASANHRNSGYVIPPASQSYNCGNEAQTDTKLDV